jgi:elongation factor 3
LDEVVDALGNKSKVKAQPKKDMSRKEKKKADKVRKAKTERGEVLSDDE